MRAQRCQGSRAFDACVRRVRATRACDACVRCWAGVRGLGKLQLVAARVDTYAAERAAAGVGVVATGERAPGRAAGVVPVVAAEERASARAAAAWEPGLAAVEAGLGYGVEAGWGYGVEAGWGYGVEAGWG